jgi:hypothetical protein
MIETNKLSGIKASITATPANAEMPIVNQSNTNANII